MFLYDHAKTCMGFLASSLNGTTGPSEPSLKSPKGAPIGPPIYRAGPSEPGLNVSSCKITKILVMTWTSSTICNLHQVHLLGKSCMSANYSKAFASHQIQTINLISSIVGPLIVHPSYINP